MEYRQSEVSGCIYRRHGTTNQVLAPYGWVLCVFLLGQSGWQQIVHMSTPVPLNPVWPT
jgi:hypothetical protein